MKQEANNFIMDHIARLDLNEKSAEKIVAEFKKMLDEIIESRKVPTFKENQWYKVSSGLDKIEESDGLWFAKNPKIANGTVISEESINRAYDNKIYNFYNSWFGSPEDYTYTEVNLNEMQQYLPKDHVDKFPVLEVGKYYLVKDDDFWMIGQVVVPNNGKDGSGSDYQQRGIANLIDSYDAFEPNCAWCYFDMSGRTCVELSPESEEARWLDVCIKAGKFINKREALKPKLWDAGTYVVFLEKYATMSLGSICEIEESLDAEGDIFLSNDFGYMCDFNSLKWFVTKAEADGFSTLLLSFANMLKTDYDLNLAGLEF